MTFDGLRAQAELYQHIAIRDLPKRYVILHFVLYGSWLAGFTSASLAIWFVVTVFEFSMYPIIKRAPNVAYASTKRLFGYLGVSFTISTMFFAPAVFLALQPDFGLYMLGVVWVLGVISGVSFMYHAMPAFFWTSAIPGFITAFVVLLAGFKIEFTQVTVTSWSLALGMLCLFTANTIRQLWDFRDTHEELDTIRAESLARLRRLEHLSSHDALTNLLNRGAFDARLGSALREARDGEPVAVILLDLNGFKPINDTYGHDAGDAVIIAVGKRLAKIANNNATVARMGGDEFAMILPAQIGEAATLALAAAILAHIKEPVIYQTALLRISASVGIAFAGGAITRASEVYAAADQAMYRAKANDDGQAVIFKSENFAPRPSLEDKNQFEIALRNGEILPYYQPKVRLETGEICGFEALARWQHPTRGTLSPGDFIADLQNLGLMSDLTYWMLRHVLIDVSDWLADGLNPGNVAVNIPEITLATQNGREDLDWLLAEYEHCRKYITFEITEDVVIARSGDSIKKAIEHFATSGVTISLDDFGTGFASFQHLQQLTFDEMKIDTSFVAGLGTDPVADVIIEGFMLIARGLGVDVTAEGVETEAQLQHLLKLGCNTAQGYYFSPAVPLAEAHAQLVQSLITAKSA